MKTIILTLILFNGGVEGLRMYDPQYYNVKEVKLKKVEQVKKICGNIIFKGQI